MANSSLQGKTFKIHDKVKKHLKKIFDAYKGDKTKEGYQRLRKLVDKDVISYEQLKRIKNFFDDFNGSVDDTSYLLNGGSIMKKWVNFTLENARKNIEGKKKSMKDVGMDNQYIKTHSKDGVKLDTHDSDVQKILRQESIYNMEIMKSLITNISKNKKLWQTWDQ